MVWTLRHEQASTLVKQFVDAQRSKKKTMSASAAPSGAELTPTASGDSTTVPVRAAPAIAPVLPTPEAPSATNFNTQKKHMMMLMMQSMMNQMGMASPKATVPQQSTAAPIVAPPPPCNSRGAAPAASPMARRGPQRPGVDVGDVNDARRGDARLSHPSSRAPHAIASRLKGKDNKKEGADKEDLKEFRAEYNAVALDYDLTASQKKQFLHNFFTGDALRFYNEERQGHFNTFNESVAVVMTHFNSLDSQQRVKADLSTLRLSKFASK